MLKYGGIVSFIGIFSCNLCSLYNIRLPFHLFWFFECSGLSSLILYLHISQEYLNVETVLNSSYSVNSPSNPLYEDMLGSSVIEI